MKDFIKHLFILEFSEEEFHRYINLKLKSKDNKLTKQFGYDKSK